MPRWSTIITILFFLYISLFFIQQPHLTTLDLGRHLVNGRELLQSPELLKTNFFSYTNPDFPFINHHWLFGWLAYQVFQIADFPGLVLLNALCIVSAVFLVFVLAKRLSSPKIALIATMTCLPLIANRTDIRPETMSFLLTAVWFFLLSRMTQQSLWKTLFVLAITQIIWVNSHLFFVFGWAIAGAFLLRALLVKKFHWQRKGLLLFCVSLPVVSLLNPSGLAGVLQPFTIFSAYNYPVAENQSLWFFLHYSPKNPQYWYASVLTLVAIFGSVAVLFKKKFVYLPLALVSIFLAVLTSQVNRVGSFLALALIPTLAVMIKALWQKYEKKIDAVLSNSLGLMIISLVGFGLLILVLATQLFTPKLQTIGFRPSQAVTASTDFFNSIETTGNIFNNYDIGSYLVYSLYPSKKVFIDNRPEAYPAEFLKHDYIAAQEDDQVWQEVVEKYKIGVIFFAYRDATDWAGPFIIERVQDSDWVPVYADNEIVILVADIPEHQDIIEKYRLPDDVFSN